MRYSEPEDGEEQTPQAKKKIFRSHSSFIFAGYNTITDKKTTTNPNKEEQKMKKLISLLTALAALLTLTALAETPVIEAVNYYGNGRAEIEFVRDVQYENLTVTAADLFGNPVNVTLVDVDDDEIDLRLENVQPETLYTLTVSGVRSGRAGAYETLTAELTTPAENALFITNVDADADDREVEIEFPGRVEYDNVTVTIADRDGNLLETRITERDDDGLELKVKGLKYGEEYTATVTGAALRGSGIFNEVKAEFTAR